MGAGVFRIAGVLITVAACGSQLAAAQADAMRFDVPAQDLATALDSVAQSAGVGLIFERARIQGVRGQAVQGRMSASQAFAQLLAGTRLSIRLIGPGNYVLVIPPPPSQAEAALPEILILGTRSQNSDVRRHSDDIQPYRVIGANDVAQAQAANPEELLRTRLASNDLIATSAQAPVTQQGSVRSQIDLRGLGTAQTLVLVDGRRMPSVPSLNEFLQPDINALPLAAIERVETFAGTAGGLYGPGATGGVINIVLNQDLPALWLRAQGGVDLRGDGAQRIVSGGFNLQSGGGRTHFGLTASHATDDGLAFGDRDLVNRARIQRYLNGGNADIASVNVNVATYAPSLTLIPTLGGTSLGSNVTNIPLNSGGATGDEAALLRAGAGTFDYRLSSDGNGAVQSFITPSTSSALIANFRQELGTKVEVFANLIALRDSGASTEPKVTGTSISLDAGQPGNPFQEPVRVTFSIPGSWTEARTRTTTLRATIGAIGHLGRGWSVEADAAYGSSATRQYLPQVAEDLNRVISYPNQDYDVLSPGTAFADNLKLATFEPDQIVRMKNAFRDVSAKLAGPIARLPGGPITLTLAAENRHERTPDETISPLPYEGFGGAPAHVLDVTSASGEARLPLVPASSPVFPLRSLEIQLAARADHYVIQEPNTLDFVHPDAADRLRAERTTLAFTVGAKMRPVEGLIIRGSFATGYLPPTPGQIVPNDYISVGDLFPDPKRVTLPTFPLRRIEYVDGGQPSLKPELARTFSGGIVIEPAFLRGLRASADYTRIEKTHEITSFAAGDYAYFIIHEDDFPGRITRLPLTAADAAAGDQLGLIGAIDATALNVGRSVLQAIDFDVDYHHRLGSSQFHLYATATWTPSYRRRDDPFAGYAQYAGQYDGPLRWKGNVGAEWQRGRLSALVNMQYYGRYRVTLAERTTADDENENRIALQGASAIPAQAYVDLGIGYAAGSGARRLHYQLSVKDAFDKLPPLSVPQLRYQMQGGSDFSPGYSTYGDPRGRRVILSVGVDM